VARLSDRIPQSHFSNLENLDGRHYLSFVAPTSRFDQKVEYSTFSHTIRYLAHSGW